MKPILLIFFFCSSIKLIAQDSPSSKLNGAWVLSKIRIDNSLKTSEHTDGPYRWIYPNMHWLFKDQKICEVDYPCCMTQVGHFVLEKETIRITGINGRQDEVFSLDFHNDSLILRNHLEYGADYYFIKDGTPVKELTKFSDGYINPICLYGDWGIPTGEVSVGFDAINVWYPWKMEEQIHVDEKNLHHYWENDRFYLEVDGVKRPFKIENVSLQNHNMSLIPEDWVKEYIQNKKLDPAQIPNVWLRKISE